MDIFTELVNVLIYGGEPVLEAETMLSGPTESLYESGQGELNSQFRDYSMYEMKDGAVRR